MCPFYALNPLRGGAPKGAKPRQECGAGPARVRGKSAEDAKEDWLLEIRIGNRANDAGWVARRDRVGRDIFGYDGAGADDDAVTQGDSFENNGARADEAAAADFHRFGIF